jgi:hypothetical protein
MNGDDALHNSIKRVYPETDTMLCTWHVNNYVATSCKKHFQTNDAYNEFFAAWRTVYQAQTIGEFERCWDKLCTDYSTGRLYKAIEYLRKEWIKPGQKERLVAAWTSEYLHFNTLVTSRYVAYRF